MAGSKKGAATDLAVDELRAQFLQFQSEIQKRLDEDAEKHQRKEAQLQDLIVNTIIEMSDLLCSCCRPRQAVVEIGRAHV